ncbi:MAG TPA: serine/threonine-protein kinase, partial [Polyangia bacterium]|nr:serine/threonine-protein kinase [Polyangia bacterium]
MPDLGRYTNMLNGSIAMFKAGDLIGSYRVRRRLGAGGMGEVFLAEHRHIDRKAAIKVLRRELSTNEDVVARFFSEARSASRIKHPGIVEIIDCEIDQRGLAYIVMELLDGESLAHCLERVGSLDRDTSLGIVGQIASALSAAHPKGIIHRDLKPDNVFLVSTPDAETPMVVKVLDFGIAKLVAQEPGEKGRTRTGSLLGTPLYMSPEQCRGAGKVDHRTDIYSLGCILFEMVAGRPPFIRDGAGELIAAHLSEAPPDILSLEPSLQPDLGHLVMRMLAKDPDARPQTMHEVVKAVEAVLGLPAAHFSKAIHSPEGFPPPADPVLPIDAAPAYPGGPESPRMGLAVGGTRLLPEETSVKVTTFSNTASELAGRATLPRGRRVGWLVAVLLGIAAVGVFVFVPRKRTVSG